MIFKHSFKSDWLFKTHPLNAELTNHWFCNEHSSGMVMGWHNLVEICPCTQILHTWSQRLFSTTGLVTIYAGSQRMNERYTAEPSSLRTIASHPCTACYHCIRAVVCSLLPAGRCGSALPSCQQPATRQGVFQFWTSLPFHGSVNIELYWCWETLRTTWSLGRTSLTVCLGIVKIKRLFLVF